MKRVSTFAALFVAVSLAACSNAHLAGTSRDDTESGSSVASVNGGAADGVDAADAADGIDAADGAANDASDDGASDGGAFGYDGDDASPRTQYVVTKLMTRLTADAWGSTARCENGDSLTQGGVQCFNGATSASFIEGEHGGPVSANAWSGRCNYSTTGVDDGATKAYTFAICQKGGNANDVALAATQHHTSGLYVASKAMTHLNTEVWGSASACKDGDTAISGGGQCFGGALSANILEGTSWAARCNYGTTHVTTGAAKAYSFALCATKKSGSKGIVPAATYVVKAPLKFLTAIVWGASPQCKPGDRVLGGGGQCFNGALSATFVDGAQQNDVATQSWSSRCNYNTGDSAAGAANAYAFALCLKH